MESPFQFLPRAYLDAIGVIADECLDERTAPSAFDLGVAEYVDTNQAEEITFDVSLQATWELTLEKIREEIAPSSFSAWASDTKARAFDGSTLTITARNDYACQWLHQHVADSALAVLADLLGAANLVFVPE